jgi:hypothetical protein
MKYIKLLQKIHATLTSLGDFTYGKLYSAARKGLKLLCLEYSMEAKRTAENKAAEEARYRAVVGKLDRKKNHLLSVVANPDF